MYQDMDGESGDTMGLTSSGEFSEQSIRRGFIRKVYGILTFQLTVTMVSLTCNQAYLYNVL